MRFFTLKSKDPDGIEQAKVSMISMTNGLQWVRKRRGKAKISSAEYIAESRFVIALDEL